MDDCIGHDESFTSITSGAHLRAIGGKPTTSDHGLDFVVVGFGQQFPNIVARFRLPQELAEVIVAQVT
jgi:hypothetical protein